MLPHLGPPMTAWKVLEGPPVRVRFLPCAVPRAVEEEPVPRGAAIARRRQPRRDLHRALHGSDNVEHNSAMALMSP